MREERNIGNAYLMTGLAFSIFAFLGIFPILLNMSIEYAIDERAYPDAHPSTINMALLK